MDREKVFNLFQKLTLQIKAKLRTSNVGEQIDQTKHLAPIILKIIEFIKTHKPDDAPEEQKECEIPNHFYRRSKSVTKFDFDRLFQNKNELRRVVIPGDDKHFHNFLQKYAQCQFDFDFNPENLKVFLIPSSFSTIGNFIASYDPLYRENILIPFDSTSKQDPEVLMQNLTSYLDTAKR